MRRLLVALAVLVAGSSGATAATLGFEDVPGGSRQNQYGDVSTYQGFRFNETLDWLDLVDSSWNYGAKSGEFALLNNYGGVGVISADDGGSFSFGGLWAKAWGTGPQSGGSSSLFGIMQGWIDGQLVWNVDTALNGTYQHFAAQGGLIDELRMGFGNHFLVDDIRLEAGNTTVAPVPLAGTLPFLLAGLGGIALVARRSKRQTAS